MKKLLLILSIFSSLPGCMAGKFDYVRPITKKEYSNSKIIERSRDDVWNKSVAQLGKQFFVINNLDKSSGLINISYSGDPEKYVDCGTITSYVKNAVGERTYQFPASSAQKSYEVMETPNLLFVNRKMSLEGRINLVFEDLGGNKTQVTANTRYAITKQVEVRNTQGQTQNLSDTVSFNSGDSGTFSTLNPNNPATECKSTGRLEQDILSKIE